MEMLPATGFIDISTQMICYSSKKGDYCIIKYINNYGLYSHLDVTGNDHCNVYRLGDFVSYITRTCMYNVPDYNYFISTSLTI